MNTMLHNNYHPKGSPPQYILKKSSLINSGGNSAAGSTSSPTYEVLNTQYCSSRYFLIAIAQAYSTRVDPQSINYQLRNTYSPLKNIRLSWFRQPQEQPTGKAQISSWTKNCNIYESGTSFYQSLFYLHPIAVKFWSKFLIFPKRLSNHCIFL